MSGDIVDMPIRKCPVCPAICIEDSRMYGDVNICPRCGASMSAAPRKGTGRIRTPLGGRVLLGVGGGAVLGDGLGAAIAVTTGSRWS